MEYNTNTGRAYITLSLDGERAEHMLSALQIYQNGPHPEMSDEARQYLREVCTEIARAKAALLVEAA